jgi:hypothetical protein
MLGSIAEVQHRRDLQFTTSQSHELNVEASGVYSSSLLQLDYRPACSPTTLQGLIWADSRRTDKGPTYEMVKSFNGVYLGGLQ